MGHPVSSPGSRLPRTMGLFGLCVYGVGDMLGAGIYALTGKVAGVMGHAAWLAFVTSMVAAVLTALSYAALGSRYPKAGGAAYVTHRAFGQPFLSYLVGLAVLASGITSMAAGANAFAGYFTASVRGFSAPAVMLAYIGLLTFVNFLGMRQSALVNTLCTLVEITGLAIVIVVAARFWGGVDYLRGPATPDGETAPLSPALALQGGALAFYAFIGFEDMLNLSEEAKNPRRDVPIAILGALGLTTLVYVAVAISAVSVVSPAALGESKQPLVDVVRTAAPAFPSGAFSIIALFAIANTGLVNHVMCSRLLLGMARQALVPRGLSHVHARRGTPHVAVLVVGVLVAMLMLPGNLRELASATSVLLLYVFIVVNGSLLVLRRRAGEPRGALEVPAVVPAAGIIVSGAMLAHADAAALRLAFLLFVVITVLYLVMRPRQLAQEALEALE